MYSLRLSLWAERGIILPQWAQCPAECLLLFKESSGRFGWNKSLFSYFFWSGRINCTCMVEPNNKLWDDNVSRKMDCQTYRMWQVGATVQPSAPLRWEDWLQQHQKSHFDSINGYFFSCDEAKNRQRTKKGCGWAQTWSPSIYPSTGSLIFLENHQKIWSKVN